MADKLFNYVSNYKNLKMYPFHMPGHKGNKNFLDLDFLSLDVTEFGFMDNLHNPKGIILESQKLASKIFGAEYSFYLVNGSSAGIIASILTVCNVGESILVARNSHRSVYSGILLAGIFPYYIYPEITSLGMCGGINKSDIEKSILENPSIKAVVITSPTYEGFCSDIKGISDITNKYNKILIVDEAHGAHFIFSDFFPNSSTKYADITIQSLHKTLPTLGQSAIVHIKGEKVDKKKLFDKISIMQTTSPSYIFMSTIDYFINNDKRKSYFENFTMLLKKYRKRFENTKTIQILTDNIIGEAEIFDIDKSKLVFFIKNDKITGYELEEILQKKYKIQIEFSSYKYIVALTSICDTEYGFLSLEQAIKEIDKTIVYSENNICLELPKAITVHTPHFIENKEKEYTVFSESIGKISTEFIIPYPPGIPVIVPGELITKEIYDYIVFLKTNEVKVIGCHDDKLNFIETLSKVE